MKIIELDLTGCKNTRDIHERIRTAFDFPDWYGKNWSAFWDLLWSECDADKVIVKGENSLPHELEGALDRLHEILERNVQACADSDSLFSYEMIS